MPDRRHTGGETVFSISKTDVFRWGGGLCFLTLSWGREPARVSCNCCYHTIAWRNMDTITFNTGKRRWQKENFIENNYVKGMLKKGAIPCHTKKTDHHRWQTFHTSWIKYTWNRNRHLIVNPCIMRSLPRNFLYRRQMSIVLKLIKMNDVCKTIWIRITTSKFVGV